MRLVDKIVAGLILVAAAVAVLTHPARGYATPPASWHPCGQITTGQVYYCVGFVP